MSPNLLLTDPSYRIRAPQLWLVPLRSLLRTYQRVGDSTISERGIFRLLGSVSRRVIFCGSLRLRPASVHHTLTRGYTPCCLGYFSTLMLAFV